MYEVVAEVWRGELVKSVHYGAVAALAMLRHGLDLPAELLALACASHSGEGYHLEGVRRILASAGLTEDALECTPGLPLGTEAMHAHLAAGLGPAALSMNCSGKHAAMLATCAVTGWPTDGYLDPGHPLQQAIRRTIEETSGEPVGAVGVDGCGAPVFGISLRGLATAFARIAAAVTGPEHRVAAAMRAHPEWVGGTGRDVTTLMHRLPGAVAKDGAEGVYAIGLPDRTAVALKIADGSSRARPVVAIAALRELGVDVAPLAALAEQPVLGHGRPVGAVRPRRSAVPADVPDRPGASCVAHG